MKKTYLFPLMGVLASTLAIQANAASKHESILPLEQPSQWQSLAYNNIPANKVSFVNKAAVIEVQSSASPLIYPFNAPLHIDTLEFKVKVTGDISLNGKKQGSKGADDAVFRLGLVYEGDKKMGFFEKKFAPKWIKTLYKLAPEGSGVDYIEFYNVYSDESIAGVKRKHPLSNLLIENNLFSYKKSMIKADDSNVVTSTISGVIKPDTDKKVLAIWISSDGDDTQSSYGVDIQALTVITR